MSMAIIAVGGTVVAAGAAGYSAYQQNKTAKAAQKAQQAAVDGANFGRIPEAALYEPVDFNNEQLKAIFANEAALPAIQNLLRKNNGIITADALKRANKLIPGYSASMRQMGLNANDLISGRLPSDVIEKVVGDRAQVSSGVNIPGLAGPATLKDLGLTSLDAINQGTGMLGKMVSMAETISPRASYMTPQSSMISPGERIRLTMEQNALIQQSEQNKNNLEAGVPPGEMARLGLQLSQPPVQDVNWAQLGGSVAQGLLSAYGQYKMGQGGGGTYMGSFATNPVPGVSNQIYRPSYSSATGVYS